MLKKAPEASVQQEFHCWSFRPNETLVIVRSVFFFGRPLALEKPYSFAIFECNVGWCELQMCMALCIGYNELEYGNALM